MGDESSDEERFDLPYNEEIDDAEGNEGSDCTDIEVLPSQKKRVIQCSDDSDDDGFVVVQYESVAGESGDRDKGSMACGSDNNHKAEKIVLKLRKK